MFTEHGNGYLGGVDRSGDRVMERQTWQDVKDKIETMYGDAEPGTPMPSVSQLEGKTHAARKTIEKALDSLLIEGFLTYRVTKGLVVTGLGHDEAIARGEMTHVLELRLAIEPAAAHAAARSVHSQTASTKHLIEFCAAYDRLRDSFMGANVRAAFSADREFHQAMFRLCDNPLLRAAVDRTNIWLKRNVEDIVSSLFGRMDYRAETEKQHDDLFQAIKLGAAKQADQAARVHLTYAHNEIISYAKRRT